MHSHKAFMDELEVLWQRQPYRAGSADDDTSDFSPFCYQLVGFSDIFLTYPIYLIYCEYHEA